MHLFLRKHDLEHGLEQNLDILLDGHFIVISFLFNEMFNESDRLTASGESIYI